MRRGPATPHSLAMVLLLGAALLAAGCNERSNYPEVSVTTPELSNKGPILTMTQWRDRVGDVCREAGEDVVAASTQLTRQLSADPGARDEGEISRRAYALIEPVLQDQLEDLSGLRPPMRIQPEYEQFIATLAKELQWTGRMAQMIGREGHEDALYEADSMLAESAGEAIRFVRTRGIEGCLLAPGTSG